MTFIKVVAAACMALTALSAGAVEIKAAVTHPYEGGIFSSGPTDDLNFQPFITLATSDGQSAT